MSLRWIHETQEPSNCIEECSDIDDSCSDDSYDSDLPINGDNKDNNQNVERTKRENMRHPITTTNFNNKGQKHNVIRKNNNKVIPCIIWDPRLPAQNPVYRTSKIKLYCRTGYHLGITVCGKVRGLANPFELQAILIICPVSFGVVRIQSAETGHYLAFSAKGRLYGEIKASKDNTEWEQWSIGSYDAFKSRKYVELEWWIGIKRNGRPKLGPKTGWGQKAIQFVPIQQ